MIKLWVAPFSHPVLTVKRESLNLTSPVYANTGVYTICMYLISPGINFYVRIIHSFYRDHPSYTR